jgi:sulfite reductase beta subunit-like hemoprotein
MVVPVMPRAMGPAPSKVRIQFPCGRITPAQAQALARTAAREGVQVRIDTDHGVWLYGVSEKDIPEELRSLEPEPRIVSCPGTAHCARALTDSRGAAARLMEVLSAHGRSLPTVRISGCPNGCAHSAVAEVGLIGCLRRREGGARECYRVFIGGDEGRSPKLAHEVGKPVAAESVAQHVEAILRDRGHLNRQVGAGAATAGRAASE